MKRKSIFAVTENGETHYGETKLYGGLAGIALRLCLNSQCEEGNIRPIFKRLDRVTEISPDSWKKIADAPDKAENYYSFIEIDADKNMVHADEDWRQERRYVKVSLDKLLKTASSLIETHRYSGYLSLDRIQLYALLEKHFKPQHSVTLSENTKKVSTREQIRSGMPLREGSAMTNRKSVAVDR